MDLPPPPQFRGRPPIPPQEPEQQQYEFIRRPPPYPPPTSPSTRRSYVLDNELPDTDIEKLCFTVNLLPNDDVPLHGLLKPRNTWMPINKSRSEKQDSETILASAIWGGNEAQAGALKVICAEQPESFSSKARQGRFRWLHICDDPMDFDRFMDVVAKRSREISEDMAAVASSLLRKVQKEYTKESLQGPYIRPGLVLRCDGRHNADLERQDDSAIFVCFPYLTQGPTPITGTRGDQEKTRSILYQPTGLLQSLYDHDTATERDMDQTHRRFSAKRTRNIVQISQMWILILGSELVVSFGSFPQSEPFETMFEKDYDYSQSEGPALVEVTDFDGQRHVFSADQCQTFFVCLYSRTSSADPLFGHDDLNIHTNQGKMQELKQLIQTTCFPDSLEVENYSLSQVDGNKILTAQQWPVLLNMRSRKIISVVLTKREMIRADEDPMLLDSTLIRSSQIKPRSQVRSRKRDGNSHSAPYVERERSGFTNNHGSRLERNAFVMNDAFFSSPQSRISIDVVQLPRDLEITLADAKVLDQFQKTRITMDENLAQHIVSQRQLPRNHSDRVDASPQEFHTKVEVGNPGQVDPSLPIVREEPEDVQSASGPEESSAHPLIDSSSAGTHQYNIPRSNRSPSPDSSSTHSVEAPNREEQFRKEIRDRLSSLETIMAKAPWNEPPPPQAPTWIRIHTKYLETETLRYFSLPWEYDSADPDYIVILQYLDESETDILFEHTRKLQDQVNRKKAHKREVIIKGQPERLARVSSTTKLNAPPILGWAADLTRIHSFSATDGESIHAERNSGNSRTLTDSLKYCLSMIEANLMLGRLDAPLPVKKRFASVYAGGRIYDEAPETSLADLKISSEFLKESEWSHPGDVPADASAGTGLPFSRDQLLTTSMAERTRWILLDSERLLDLFVGKEFDSKVMRKCWGAVQLILRSLKSLKTDLKHADSIMPQTEEIGLLFHERSVYWIISGFSSLPTENQERSRALELEVPISECQKCQDHQKYYNPVEALNHLRLEHFISSEPNDVEHNAPLSRPSTTNLMFWVRNNEQLRIEKRHEKVLRVLDEFTEMLSDIFDQVVEIQFSVTKFDASKPVRYQLPTAFLTTAQRLVEFFLASSYSLEMIHKSYETWEYRPKDEIGSALDKEISLLYNLMEFLRSGAEASLRQAEIDLLLMARTDGDGSIVTCTEIGPEMLMAHLMVGLTDCPLSEDKSPLKLYTRYLSTLRYKTYRRPQKRLLRELYHFQEELLALQTVFTAQNDLLTDFATVLNPTTYRITTESRITLYKTEKEIFSTWKTDREKGLAQLAKMMEHISDLQKTARHGIEIIEEDQGRIMLVFTIVTVIFLPLSFVASFFGMNTKDIRNMGYTQWIYWAVALPLTVIIIGLSVVAFGRMSEIQDAFSRLWVHLKWKPGVARRHMRLPSVRDTRTEIEESNPDERQRGPVV